MRRTTPLCYAAPRAARLLPAASSQRAPFSFLLSASSLPPSSPAARAPLPRQTHEWGGLAAPWITARRFADPGRRLPPTVVQLHGGSLWSSEGGERADDVPALRIDGAEKAATEGADAVAAPTR